MPWEMHGFGTMFYGSCDRTDDGSFTTTKWATVLYVPLFPLGSYRVRPADGKGFSLIGFGSSYPTEKVELNLRQIASVYLIAIGFCLLLVWASFRFPFFK
jgi:hypothetical protein